MTTNIKQSIEISNTKDDISKGFAYLPFVLCTKYFYIHGFETQKSQFLVILY